MKITSPDLISPRLLPFFIFPHRRNIYTGIKDYWRDRQSGNGEQETGREEEKKRKNGEQEADGLRGGEGGGVRGEGGSISRLQLTIIFIVNQSTNYFRNYSIHHLLCEASRSRRLGGDFIKCLKNPKRLRLQPRVTHL